MKYAKKMILIPAGRDTPAESQLSELDNELNLILKRKNIDQGEKIKMYNQVLARYLAIQNNVKKVHYNENDSHEEKRSFKRKLSEYDVSENKKIKPSLSRQTFPDIPESSYDEYEDASLPELETYNNRTLDLPEMELLNDYVMKKSPSFEPIFEKEKNQNQFLKRTKQINNKQGVSELKQKLISWMNL